MPVTLPMTYFALIASGLNSDRYGSFIQKKDLFTKYHDNKPEDGWVNFWVGNTFLFASPASFGSMVVLVHARFSGLLRPSYVDWLPLAGALLVAMLAAPIIAIVEFAIAGAKWEDNFLKYKLIYQKEESFSFSIDPSGPNFCAGYSKRF